MSKAELEAVDRLRTFVRERREKLRFRQQDVSEHTGLSMGWIGMLESGKVKHQPRTDTLHKLVKGLALPGEHVGSLFNFLELVMAGRVSRTLVDQVAGGKKPVGYAMKDILEGRDANEPLPGDPDSASELFHNRQLRSDRLETILSLLKVDLHPYDFALLSKLIERFYEDVPVQPEPGSPQSAPRRRAHRGEWP